MKKVNEGKKVKLSGEKSLATKACTCRCACGDGGSTVKSNNDTQADAATSST